MGVERPRDGRSGGRAAAAAAVSRAASDARGELGERSTRAATIDFGAGRHRTCDARLLAVEVAPAAPGDAFAKDRAALDGPLILPEHAVAAGALAARAAALPNA